MAVKRNALGRGLDSLIPMDDVPASDTSAINEIPLDRITPNPDQPRRNFDEEALRELAESIAQLGIIQPLSLRLTGPDTYQIIAGERRYRAALMAGLASVPAYIRTASETELTEMALIENIQREDLNAIEIALTFRKLINQHGLTQERLSERIGKKRATIANFMRLLKLPADVQLGLSERKIDMGHARALLTISDPALARTLEANEGKEKARSRSAGDFAELRQHLSAVFRTPVQFACDNNGRGRITLQFKDENELQRLITLFDSLKQNDL